MQPRMAGTLAEKDCKTCNRRRIRCDRRVPNCSKCSNKGLVCPGYKQTLRWANAIAVRGRFRGLSAPDDGQAALVREPTTGPNDAPELTAEEIGAVDVTATLRQFTDPTITRLLHYYETEITPIMTWIDSDCNGYRRLILPLAETQPVLRLAILVTAARHAATETGVDEDLLRSASEITVKMITLRLTQLTSQDPSAAIQFKLDITDMQAIIAAVLVLSDYSLLRSNLAIAQFHREGIRTLINTLTGRVDHKSELLIFLKHEAAAYDVLACTTLFEIERVRQAILPGTLNSIFDRFLMIVHAITMRSLPLTVSNPNVGHDRCSSDNEEDLMLLPGCTESVTELEQAFEAARGSTLLAAGSLLSTASETLRHDFVRVVTAFHHAGLLYAYKRLSHIEMEHRTWLYHLTRLFDAIEHIIEIRGVLSTLTWPLFIAGICSAGDADCMHKVDVWCQLLVADIRYEHYNLLTKFLRELHRDPEHDWIALAKEYERKHHPVVAI